VSALHHDLSAQAGTHAASDELNDPRDPTAHVVRRRFDVR
jgi:hypothetical protein